MLLEGDLTFNHQVWVTVPLIAGAEVEVLVDTGFEGALILPKSLIYELGLTIIGHEDYEMVGKAVARSLVAWAQIEWLGKVQTVEVLAAEDYLLGTDLLADARLTIDYVAGSFVIERLR